MNINEDQKDISQPATTRCKRRPTAPKSKKFLWLTVILEGVVLLALVIGLITVLTRNPLEGTWYYQGRVTYKFGNAGKGVLILEDDFARFRYEIDGDTVEVDYDSEDIADCTYRFWIEDDTLYLDDGSETGPKAYTPPQ